MGDATAGLELWTSPAVARGREGENVVAAAARLAEEFSSVQDGVRALQESFAKVGGGRTGRNSTPLSLGRGSSCFLLGWCMASCS